MKKTAIASAVAAALAFAGAAQADVTIYGKMHYIVDFGDDGANGGDNSDSVTGENRASRIGFKGSEDLGNGMKAVFKIETGVGGTVGNRNTYAGIAGGFGTVLMGNHDTPYKISTGSLDLFGDTRADYNSMIGATRTLGVDFDERAGATIAYISPTFSGFHVAAAYVAADVTDTAANAKETSAYSLAGIYKNGPLFATLAIEHQQGATGIGINNADAEGDALKLGLGYKTKQFRVGFIYETIEQDDFLAAQDIEQDTIMLNGAMNFGANTLKIQYLSNGDEKVAGADVANSGASQLSIGLDHKMSKRTSVYALYTSVSNDANSAVGLSGLGAGAAGADPSSFSFGLVHKF